jgi:hypothetical protein
MLQKVEEQVALDAQNNRVSPNMPAKGSVRLVTPNNNSNSYKLMQKAAKLDILIADCMQSPIHLGEKIEAFRRATELYLGMRVPGIPFKTQNTLPNNPGISSEDAYTALSKLSPYLIKMLLRTIGDKVDSVKIASLKSIEFLLEIMGCSLDSYIV